MLAAYTGSPILPHTFDLEDGFLAGDSIFTYGLGSKFTTDGGVKRQRADREVVKVPLESAVLKTQDHSGEIIFVSKNRESGTLSFLPLNVNLV